MKENSDKLSREKSSQKNSSREKISWKEVYMLNKRALCLWCRECPMLFVSSGLHSIIAALIPYLTLYFSARLLDELAGTRMPEKMDHSSAFFRCGGLFFESAGFSMEGSAQSHASLSRRGDTFPENAGHGFCGGR